MLNLFCICSILILSLNAFSSTGQAINVYIENDSHKIGGPGSDNAYTSGIKFSYIFAYDRVPEWGQAILRPYSDLTKTLQESQSNFSASLGQQIFTPSDTGAVDPILNDRPYAAWLYVGLAANFKDEFRNHVLELDLGYIGPEAGGESFQNGYHKMIGEELAHGWKNQLGSEPAVQLSYQQRQKYHTLSNEKYKKYFDVIPVFGGGFGNVSINTYLGVLARLGNNLPDNFGPTRSSGSEGDGFVEAGLKTWRDTSYYGFAGARGIVVLRNIFLDGNSFKYNGPHVHKKYFVGETEVGLGGQFYAWNFTWSFITRTPEFDERNEFNSFASIAISYSLQ